MDSPSTVCLTCAPRRCSEGIAKTPSAPDRLRERNTLQPRRFLDALPPCPLQAIELLALEPPVLPHEQTPDSYERDQPRQKHRDIVT